MANFHVAGKLNHFDIEQMARAFASRDFGYGGVISGDVQAAGNIKKTSDLVANASFSANALSVSRILNCADSSALRAFASSAPSAVEQRVRVCARCWLSIGCHWE